MEESAATLVRNSQRPSSPRGLASYFKKGALFNFGPNFLALRPVTTAERISSEMSSRSSIGTPRVAVPFLPESPTNFGDFDPQKLGPNKEWLQRAKAENAVDIAGGEAESPARGECGDCVSRGREMAIHVATLESKLSEETQTKNRLSSAMSVLEKRMSERDEEIEILNLERREFELECNGLREQLEITSKHLATIEISFNDVHEKYERAKQTIQISNRNVEILKESLAERDLCISQKHEQFLKLKEHAMERMDRANSQLDLIERKYSLESSKLRAAVREAELDARSLSEQLEQRNKDNAELTSICDGLIEKMDAQRSSAVSRIDPSIGKLNL